VDPIAEPTAIADRDTTVLLPAIGRYLLERPKTLERSADQLASTQRFERAIGRWDEVGGQTATTSVSAARHLEDLESGH
jgi:hypothetical protein